MYINECINPTNVNSEVPLNQPHVNSVSSYIVDIGLDNSKSEYNDVNNRYSVLSSDLLSKDDMYDFHEEIDDVISDDVTVKVLSMITTMIKRVNVNNNFRDKVKRTGKSCIYLDTCAEETLFSNASLFYNLSKSVTPIIVTGDNKNGKGLYINIEGKTVFGDGYYNKACVGNILSFGKTRDTCNDLHYHKGNDVFLVQVKCGGPVYLFSRCADVENIYVCDMDHEGDILIHDNSSMNNQIIRDYIEVTQSQEERQVSNELLVKSIHEHELLRETKKLKVLSLTVQENKLKYTKLQNSQADKAREYQRKLGYSTEQQLIKLVNRNKLTNNKITAQDVMRSLDIYGPSLGGLKGKTTSHKSPIQTEIELVKSIVQTDQTMCSDLMFVNGRPFFVSVFLPSDFVMVSKIKSKSELNLLQPMLSQLRHVKNRGFKVPTIRVDGESAIGTDFFRDQISKEVGTVLDPCGADEHIEPIERKIRQIKELVRCVSNMLHFNLYEILLDWLIRYAVSRIILLPTRNSEEYISPREKIYGKIIDVDKELKHGFGDFVHVHPDRVDNTNRSRGHVGIALMPSGNTTGSWVYYLLHNGETVIRGKVTNLPMSDDVIIHLNNLAKRNKGKYPNNKCPVFDIGTAYNTLDDDLESTNENNKNETTLPAMSNIRHDDDGDEQQVVLDNVELDLE